MTVPWQQPGFLDETDWLIYRVTGDDVLTLALLAAGAAVEDIPYDAPVRVNMRWLTDMLNAIESAAQDAEG